MLSFLEEEKWRLKMKLHCIYSNYFQWKHLLNNLFIFTFVGIISMMVKNELLKVLRFIQKASSFNAMVNNNKNPNLTNGKYNYNSWIQPLHTFRIIKNQIFKFHFVFYSFLLESAWNNIVKKLKKAIYKIFNFFLNLN